MLRPPPLLLQRASFLLLLLFVQQCRGRLVRFDNTQPMRDRQGRIMDAHDGTVQRFHDRGPFFMHAVSYGLCEVGALR